MKALYVSSAQKGAGQLIHGESWSIDKWMVAFTSDAGLDSIEKDLSSQLVSAGLPENPPMDYYSRKHPEVKDEFKDSYRSWSNEQWIVSLTYWDYRRMTDVNNKALHKGTDPEGYELGISPID